LKSLAVLALKREGILVTSDRVGVVISQPVKDLKFDQENYQDFTQTYPEPVTVFAALDNNEFRKWTGSRVEVEQKLRNALEGR
jgi:hypothetical protein